jgi:hypothetical protein
VIDPAAAAAMTDDDHRRGFAAATASLLAEFNAYLDRPQPNPTTDSVSYRQFPLWLTDAERTALVEEVSALVQARLVHDQTPERKRHSHDGNEEAAHRLSDLAADRGDVEELRRLVDEGNDEADRQLTKLIRDFELVTTPVRYIRATSTGALSAPGGSI